MEKIKATLRIPTEQYGFVEFEVEDTAENIQSFYYEMIEQYKDGFGLEIKEYNGVIDTYLRKGEMESDLYEKMSTKQKEVIQTIKRSFNRIKSKE